MREDFILVNKMRVESMTELGIVIPSGPHIFPEVLGLFDVSGFKYELQNNGSLHGHMENFPATLTVLNHRDVIEQVASGRFALGLVGTDRLAEHEVGLTLPTIEELGRFALFPKTLRLSILTKDDERHKEVRDLANQIIATSYPGLTSQYFDRAGIQIVSYGKVSGKEEGLVASGRADAAVVIVATGNAMRMNNLKELGVIMRDIQVALISNRDFFENNKGKQRLLRQFLGRFLPNGKAKFDPLEFIPQNTEGLPISASPL